MSISVCMMLRICPIQVSKCQEEVWALVWQEVVRQVICFVLTIAMVKEIGGNLKNCEMSSAPWQVGNHFLKIELAPGSLFPAISGSMASTMRCRASGIPEILRAQPSSFMELLLRCYVSFCQWSISRQKNSGPIRRISEPISSGQCRVAQITKSQR